MLDAIIDKIKTSKKIGISFHCSPDGDSLGSALALMLGLQKLNKDVYIICKDALPEIYKFLPSSKEAVGYNDTTTADTDCVIVLDCGNLERVSANLNLEHKDYTLINIDHHLSNGFYGDLNFVETTASAVGEIVYKLLKLLSIDLNVEIATCLYTSIVSDTGGFKHSNTTSATHEIAGKLIDTRIKFDEIHRILFQNKKFRRVKLYGKVIEKMYLLHNDRLCVMKLSKEMLKEVDLEASDTSDIISIGVDIESVEVAILLKETDEAVKVSLRSKSSVDVRKVAEGFGGGGHIRAAGLTLNTNLCKAEELVVKAIEKELIR